MTTLVFDPGLFEISAESSKEEQIEHFNFLKNSIAFAVNYLDVVVDTYNGAPYHHYYNPPSTCCVPPITKSLTVKNKFSEIRKDLLRMMRNGQDITLSGKTAYCDTMVLDPDSVTTVPFLAYVYSLIFNSQQGNSYLLLLSKVNDSCAPIVTFQSEGASFTMTAVSNPAIDCNGVIFEYFKACANANEMFPQKGTCIDLNQAFLDIVTSSQLSVPEKKIFYKKFGDEVASRNYYQNQPEISRRNPQYKVYVHAHRRYYLSIDCEHGAIEIFSCNGQHPIHLGEYNFSCNFQKDADPTTHKLRV